MRLDPTSFILGLAAGAVAFLGLLCAFLLAKPWIKALLCGCPVPLFALLAMRLRGNPPALLIDAYVILKKAGVPAEISFVEATYLACPLGATTAESLAELVKAELEKQSQASRT